MSVISRSCNARVELVEPAQIHWLLQQRHNIRVESLPVGVLKMILLATFPFISLHNSERSRILVILHDVPSNRFAVLAVDLAGFDQFVLQLFNVGWGVFCVEVNNYSVDHFER